MNFKKGIASIILEIAVVAIIIGAFILANPKFKFSPQTTPSPAVSPSPPPTDETANWETYTNQEIGITFKHPNLTITSEDIEELQSTVIFETLGAKYTLTKIKTVKNNPPSYLETNRQKTISGILWKDFVPENNSQYCDAGECGRLLPAYYTFRNGYIYIFYYLPIGNMELTEKILSTFKFLDSSPQPSPSKSPTVCIQVIQPAINQQTGECKNFPTPCDVPEGWNKVSECPSTSECQPPPKCNGQLIYGDPNPSDPNQCPRYYCAK